MVKERKIFTESNDFKNNLKETGKHHLLNKLYGGLSVFSFLFALYFVVTNLTGNVTGGESVLKDFRWLGICFFVCGLVFTFIYFGERKK